MCHTGWRRTRLVRPVCHEAWPRLSLGMSSPIGTEPWWDAERRARGDPRAPHPARVRRLATRLSAFRFLAFFRSFLGMLKARIVRMPVSTAGVLWRRSVRRAKRFVVLFDAVTMTRVRTASRERERLRHCEERSDEAIQGPDHACPGLLRCARNDECDQLP